MQNLAKLPMSLKITVAYICNMQDSNFPRNKKGRTSIEYFLGLDYAVLAEEKERERIVRVHLNKTMSMTKQKNLQGTKPNPERGRSKMKHNQKDDRNWWNIYTYWSSFVTR